MSCPGPLVEIIALQAVCDACGGSVWIRVADRDAWDHHTKPWVVFWSTHLAPRYATADVMIAGARARMPVRTVH